MYCAVVGMSKYIFRETPTRRAGRVGGEVESAIFVGGSTLPSLRNSVSEAETQWIN